MNGLESIARMAAVFRDYIKEMRHSCPSAEKAERWAEHSAALKLAAFLMLSHALSWLHFQKLLNAANHAPHNNKNLIPEAIENPALTLYDYRDNYLS